MTSPQAGTFSIVRTVADLRAAVAAWRAQGLTVGLVPTMGALHQGHLSLVARGLAQTDRVIATIFVNPKQFGPREDLDRYPRQEAADVAKLTEAGAHMLFAPGVDEMYPPGFATTVSVAQITGCLCGPVRPGHFEGVATVVTKLLLQALPDAAMFGEKDYQQLQVIRRMARDLDIPVRIVGCPTIREADGLAMSSRNALLSAEDRARAPTLHRVLTEIAARLAKGEPVAEPLAWGLRSLKEAGFGPPDYLEVRDGETLALIDQATPTARVFVAVPLGPTRLIDNIGVGPAD